MKIIGVDFSGAKAAAKKTWICEAEVEGDTMNVQQCYPAGHLIADPPSREACYANLVFLVSKNPRAIIGFDFPFSLPVIFLEGLSWIEWVRNFHQKYESVDHFREACRANGSKELKRKTDIETKTLFSPYNLRLYRQTFYGIGQVLNPMVSGVNPIATVAPMQPKRSNQATVVEICPASTLKFHDLYIPYKGKGLMEARAKIIWIIQREFSVRISHDALEAMQVDKGGDALDSFLAAFAVFRNLTTIINPRKVDPIFLQEGLVYV